MRLPNFLVLGPPRTATTWLFRCICRHPQIYVPEIKETHYFDQHYDRKIEWYGSFFRDVSDSVISVGDLTPSYYAHPDAPARIRETLGDKVKLFVVFRDPVERAFSEYQMKKGAGVLKGSFLEALQTDTILVERSLYAKNLQRFRSHFAAECFYVLPYRLSHEDPVAFLSRFFEAIGVRSDYRPQMIRTRINEGLSGLRRHGLYGLSLRLKEKIEAAPMGRWLLWMLRERGVVRLWHQSVAAGNAIECTVAEREIASSYFADDLALFRSFGPVGLLENSSPSS